MNPSNEVLSKPKCPDCGASVIKENTGYCRPAGRGEPGTWIVHCLNCHINDVCEIPSTHGSQAVAEARAAKVESTT